MGALEDLAAEGLEALGALGLSDLLEEAPARPRLPRALEEGARARRGEIVREGTARPELQRELAERLAGELRELLHLRHQFLQVDAGRERALFALASSFVDGALRALASHAPWPEVVEALRDALASHRARLRALVLELLAECGSIAPGAPPPGESVCAEYSPELQLEVLGVSAGELRPPVLDLGCGPGAALVHFLRRAGREPVWGLDRSAPASEGFLRLSWFDSALPRDTFGTVLSHQAFSLHFVHAHHRSAARAAAFAAKYMEILRSLLPGGRFYYAPSLPFVEEHLDPAAFAVSVRRVADTEFYAACVERRVTT
jgi:SAM-dependent methyltransferase